MESGGLKHIIQPSVLFYSKLWLSTSKPTSFTSVGLQLLEVTFYTCQNLFLLPYIKVCPCSVILVIKYRLIVNHVS